MTTNMLESRTLLILKNQNTDDITFENVVKQSESPQGNKFIEFSSIDAAKNEYNKLVDKNIQCKFSNYNLFVRFNLEKNNNKEELVNKISENLVSKVSNINILKIDLYEKENKMLGFGKLVVDRLEDVKTILSDNKLELSDDNVVLFFKFNRSR